ncbi:MAG: 6-phosphofructokinase, partial [Clostridia bacterium]|nr:6-phosphofructokinase [Clostridia bacterium]
ENLVSQHINTKVRSIELSTLQRCAGHLTSRTDVTEAYQVGGAAVHAALKGETSKMVVLKRLSDNPYQCTTDLYEVSEIANLEKTVPEAWMDTVNLQMNPAFLEYARPLIQAELPPMYISGLPHHIRLK